MYQFAYSAICEELPAPASPPSHYHMLPDAVELLEAADRARPASHEQLQLLSDFRRLWLAIANDLIHACHELPAESQTSMLSAANGVLEEIERRRFKGARAARGRAKTLASELLL
ncbi:MAG: flagellar biosynthesis regulator FlaF [Rhodomicrobium sp.]